MTTITTTRSAAVQAAQTPTQPIRPAAGQAQKALTPLNKDTFSAAANKASKAIASKEFVFLGIGAGAITGFVKPTIMDMASGPVLRDAAGFSTRSFSGLATAAAMGTFALGTAKGVEALRTKETRPYVAGVVLTATAVSIGKAIYTKQALGTAVARSAATGAVALAVCGGLYVAAQVVDGVFNPHTTFRNAVKFR